MLTFLAVSAMTSRAYSAHMTRVLATVFAVVLMIVPTSAIGQQPQTNAPPGNSAVDEYLETVPEAGGNRAPGAREGGSKTGGLTPAQRARLKRLGPDGAALAEIVDATPARTTTSSPEKLDAVQGRSPIVEVVDAATGGGGGMGAVLPAILLATLLGVIAVAVMRRRAA